MKKLKVFRVCTVPLALLGYGCHLEALAGSDNIDLTVVTTGDEYIDRLSNLRNVKTIAVTIKREINILHDIFSLLKLVFLFLKEKPDVIHSNTPKGGLVCALAGFVARVPLRIHTYTGQRWVTQKGFGRRLGIFFDKLILILNSSCFADSFGQARFLNRLFRMKNKKVGVIGKGSFGGVNFQKVYEEGLRVDVQKERSQLGVNEDDILFLFLGRVTREKGIQELLQAYLETSKLNKKVKLLIVGPYERELDPLEPHFHQIYENSNCFIKLGFSSDVTKLMKICDCFVLPSYREGFGTVVLEAASLKKPSIVSDIYGLKSIIKDKESGLVCSTRDSKSLALAMQFVIDNPDKLIEMGESAYMSVKENYDHRKVSADLKDFYEKTF